MEEISGFDVVIVGGGLAGLMVANRVVEDGKRPLVLEKGTEAKYPCNTRYTGGTFHVALNDIMAERDFLLKEIERATCGYARPDLATAVVDDGPRSIRWLQSIGGKFIKGNAASYQNWVLAPPPARTATGLDWEGRGGDVLLQTLEARLAKHGGELRRGVRVRSLVMNDGRCVGVEADTSSGSTRFLARATVVADGGFQGAPDLVAKTITVDPAKLRQRGAGTGAGDGLRMAQAAGASLTALDRFYGHLLSIDALTNDRLWPYPYMDSVATVSILVDRSGKRFADEGRGGVFLANMIAKLDDPLSAFLVFDHTTWEGPAKARHVPPNPHLKNAGGTLFSAGTITELAAQAGIDAGALAATVAQYNEAVGAGRFDGLEPQRTPDRYKPLPIVNAPFYAMPLCAGITNTMGGILTDDRGRVLDTDEKPIAGLFAAGCTTGGLEGGPCAGYVGGLAKTSAMSLRVGETIGQM